MVFHRNASVAQWIEQCPPEACATVRLRSDADNLVPGSALTTVVMVLLGIFLFHRKLRSYEIKALREDHTATKKKANLLRAD